MRIDVAFSPTFALSQYWFDRQLRARADRARKQQAALLNYQHEIFSAVQHVQLCVAERFERTRHATCCRELIKATIDRNVLEALAALAAGLVVTLGPTLVILVGGRQVLSGTMTMGTFIAFYAYVNRLLSPIHELAQFHVALLRTSVSRERLDAYLKRDSKLQLASGTTSRLNGRGAWYWVSLGNPDA